MKNIKAKAIMAKKIKSAKTAIDILNWRLYNVITVLAKTIKNAKTVMKEGV